MSGRRNERNEVLEIGHFGAANNENRSLQIDTLIAALLTCSAHSMAPALQNVQPAGPRRFKGLIDKGRTLQDKLERLLPRPRATGERR
jgi:hypothetical protein